MQIKKMKYSLNSPMSLLDSSKSFIFEVVQIMLEGMTITTHL